MGLFTKFVIALELGTSLPFKKKQQIRKQITENDGIISFIITKKVWLIRVQMYIVILILKYYKALFS